MLAELIDKIVGLSTVQVVKHQNKTFVVDPRDPVKMMALPNNEPRPDSQNVNTLHGFVAAVVVYNERFDVCDAPPAVFVSVSWDSVELCEYPDSETGSIFPLVSAKPHTHGSVQRYNAKQDEFCLALQTDFVQTEAQQKLLALAGNIVAESITTSTDDGVSSVVTRRKGIASKSRDTAPSLITLQPWLTFDEIQQPEIMYALRIKSNEDQEPTFSLTPSKATQWKLKAERDIAEYIENSLNQHNIDIPILF